ncbi:MAG: putative metal-binding motif-containing protein [Deltaproteobacteria bacterium]|nr:putative metal-binding motif-containing protein [Deltaproteobacteria bacterium]
MNRIYSRALSVSLFVAVFLSSDCSLMGLDDITTVKCRDEEGGKPDNSLCEPLNQSLPKDACRVYQCAEDGIGCVLSIKDSDGDNAIDSRCKNADREAKYRLDCDDTTDERAPDKEEKPDGIDNDCDLIVDEGQIVDLNAPNALEHNAGGEPSHIVYSSGSAGEVFLSYQVDEQQVKLAYLSDLSQPAYYSLDPDGGEACRTLCNPEKCSDDEVDVAHPELRVKRSKCKFSEVVAGTGFPRLAAGINQEGVTVGQLRVGFIDENPKFINQVPSGNGLERASLSNTYNGIDVDIDAPTPYSGESHPSSPGAGRLNIASSKPEGRSPRALLTWVGDKVERESCPNAANPVPVQALGLWLEEVIDKRWVQASNNAVPQTLGQTLGGGRPAVALWPREANDKGYFVAYSDQEGQVVLHYISELGELPDYQSEESWNTPALTIHAAYRFSSARDGADHVAIAPANSLEIRSVCGPGQTGLEIGVAWQQGCASADASIFFAVVGFVTATETFCLQREIVEIAAGDATQGGFIPTIVYLAEGFVEPGFGEGITAGEKTKGGWLVAWVGPKENGDAVYAQRVAEFDGKRLDSNPIELAEGLNGTLSHPVLYRCKKKGARFVFYRGESNEFVGRDLMACQ